jgi:hypothetical protein
MDRGVRANLFRMTPRRSTRDWTDRTEHDPGIALVELLAYIGEVLSSYQEQVAAEARLKTVRRLAIALGALAILVLWRCRRDD